jgi:hypothetical protein
MTFGTQVRVISLFQVIFFGGAFLRKLFAVHLFGMDRMALG